MEIIINRSKNLNGNDFIKDILLNIVRFLSEYDKRRLRRVNTRWLHVIHLQIRLNVTNICNNNINATYDQYITTINAFDNPAGRHCGNQYINIDIAQTEIDKYCWDNANNCWEQCIKKNMLEFKQPVIQNFNSEFKSSLDTLNFSDDNEDDDNNGDTNADTND